jgi:hypothetical protein
MTYKPDISQGDWLTHRRTVGVPGADTDFIGVETIPSILVGGSVSANQTPIQYATSASAVSGTTNGTTTITTTTTLVQVGMAVTGTNIPNSYAVTSGDSFDTNQITVGTVTNSSGYTGGFQTGMLLNVLSTTTPNSGWTGHPNITAMITSVSGSTITLDRKINVPSNTRVGAFPVVTSKTSTTVTISIAASGSGTQTITYYWVNACSMNASLVYVPRTINVSHARLSHIYLTATLTALSPMPSDIQDARILIWGPTSESEQYMPPMSLYAVSRNLMSHGDSTRDRWSNATASSDVDNSSLFTASQATIQPITGTGTLTSVSTTTSTTLTSASGQAVLQVASTTGITTGMTVTAPNVAGIPINTTVSSIGTGTVTLSNNLTATIGTSAQLYFGTLTSVTNDSGYTVAVPGSFYLTGTGIPQGVSTVSTTVSSNTSVTVADASSFQIGMAVVSHNAITSASLITAITGNVLTLSAAISVTAGAGLYGFVRVSSATSAGPGATINMNNAPIASGAVSWSAYPYIGYNPTSATSTPLYLKVPSGTLKRNQVLAGAGLGTGSRIQSAYPVSAQTNVWVVSLASVAFSGTPGIPMTHYTATTVANSTANNIPSTAGLATNQGYVYSGTVVSGGYMAADTRFIGTGGLTKPALSSGTSIQATITPTVTIRPNHTLDTKYGIGGFSAWPQGATTSANATLSNFALANPNPAFSSPVTLYGGYWYYIGVWYGGTSYSSPSVSQSGVTLDWVSGRVPTLPAKQYPTKYLSNNPGNWSAGSAPSTPTSLATWNGGYQVAGSAAPAVPYKSVSQLTSNGIAISTDYGYSNAQIPYIMLYE